MTFAKFLFVFSIFTFLLLNIINITSADDRSTFFAAMQLREEGKFQEAISLLEQVKGKLSITAEFQIAQIYENDIGNYSVAIEKYSALRTKYPNSLWSEHIEKSLSFLQSNLDFDGKPMSKYKRAEKLYAEQRQEEAIDLMKSIIEQFPTTKLADDVLYWVGQQCYFTQRYDEAINYLAILIEQHYDSRYMSETLKILGSSYVLTKQQNQALETYRQALQFDLTNIERVEMEYAIEELQEEILRQRLFYLSPIIMVGIIIALVIKPRRWPSIRELRRLILHFLIIFIPLLVVYVLLRQTEYGIDLKVIHAMRHIIISSFICIIAYFTSSLINEKLIFHRTILAFLIHPAITLTVTVTFLYAYFYFCELLFIFGL